MKNCKKGYSCGATCINRERSCSKELTGQAIEIASVLVQRIQEAAPPVATTAGDDVLARVKTKEFSDFHDAAETRLGKPEQVREHMNKVTNLLMSEEMGLHIAIDKDVLGLILNDGRLKSQFETGTSGGLLSKSKRSDTEKRIMGYSKDTPDVDRPIYGFVAKKVDPKKSSKRARYRVDYGNVELELNDDVKQRASVTIGDSLNWGGKQTKLVASPITNVRAGSYPQDVLEDSLSQSAGKSKFGLDEVLGGYEPYVEFQASNITVKDIKKITLHEDVVKPSRSVMRKLEELGIEVVICYGPWEQRSWDDD